MLDERFYPNLSSTSIRQILIINRVTLLDVVILKAAKKKIADAVPYILLTYFFAAIFFSFALNIVSSIGTLCLISLA